MQIAFRHIRVGGLGALMLLSAAYFVVRPYAFPASAAPAQTVPAVHVVPAAQKPAASDAWANLAQAQTERLTFPGYSVRDTDTYDWLPDGRALLVRFADGTDHHRLYAASARKVSAFQAFNRKFSETLHAYEYLGVADATEHRPPTYTAPVCCLSPDAKRLLWLEDTYQHTNLDGMIPTGQLWEVADLKGRRRREWNPETFYSPPDSYDEPHEACWLCDSNRWLVPVNRDGKWIRCTLLRVDRLRYRKFIRFRKSPDIMYAKMLGETKDGSVLAAEWTHAETDQADMTRFVPVGRNALPDRFAIHLPLRGEVQTVRLAPQGDKLAWVIQKENKAVLWISDTNGKTLCSPVAVPASLDITSLRWQQGGKHITFLQFGDLYRVSLPQSPATHAAQK